MANACLVVVFFSQRSIFKERKAHSVVLSIVFMAEILLSCSLILYLWCASQSQFSRRANASTGHLKGVQLMVLGLIPNARQP